MTLLGQLRQSYSELQDLFAYIRNKNDIQAYQDFLADDRIRDAFYKKLSLFSRYFFHALRSDAVYNAMDEGEIRQYKRALRNYQKLRRDVKIIYNDGIDFKEYEPQMRKLMDTYVTAEKVEAVTKPVDIMDKLGVEEEINSLYSPKSKAEAIISKLNKSLSEHYDRNPVLVERFRKRINRILEDYRNRRINEVELLEQTRKASDDYRGGETLATYPKQIQNKPRVQAVYDLLQKHLSGKDESGETQAFAELAGKVIEGAGKHIKVGYQDNPDVKKSIEQEIYTTWFEYCNHRGIDVDLNKLDKLMPILIKTIRSQDWGL